MTDYNRLMLFLKNLNQLCGEFVLEGKGRYVFLKDSKMKSMNVELFFDKDDSFEAMWTGKERKLAVYDEGRRDVPEWLKEYGDGDYLDGLLGSRKHEELPEEKREEIVI